MEKKKNNLIPIVIILIVLVLGLGGFIVYDKVLNNNEDNNVVNNNGLDELQKIYPFSMGYDKLGIEVYLEENYLKYLPIHWENNEQSSYEVKNLTDKEISMTVWRYIVWNYGLTDLKSSMPVSHINSFIGNFLNLNNYNIKDMEITDNYFFGLEKQNDNYIASLGTSEYTFPKYRITDIKYDINKKEILVYFDTYTLGYPPTFKENSGIATFKTDTIDKIWLERVEFDK